jgi:hypothetical protein
MSTDNFKECVEKLPVKFKPKVIFGDLTKNKINIRRIAKNK